MGRVIEAILWAGDAEAYPQPGTGKWGARAIIREAASPERSVCETEAIYDSRDEALAAARHFLNIQRINYMKTQR